MQAGRANPRARQRKDVLRLLLQKERLAGLRRNGRPALPVRVRSARGWSQEWDITHREEAAVAGVLVLDFHGPDEL